MTPDMQILIGAFVIFLLLGTLYRRWWWRRLERRYFTNWYRTLKRVLDDRDTEQNQE